MSEISNVPCPKCGEPMSYFDERIGKKREQWYCCHTCKFEIGVCICGIFAPEVDGTCPICGKMIEI